VLCRFAKSFGRYPARTYREEPSGPEQTCGVDDSAEACKGCQSLHLPDIRVKKAGLSGCKEADCWLNCA